MPSPETQFSLPSRSFKFLNDLKVNNNRSWFNNHKGEYEAAREPVLELAAHLLQGLNHIDRIETPSAKKAMYRIYRDVRFSKDKTPYNGHWSGLFKRATKSRRGSFYFRIEPGDNSMIGGGFWGPNSADMKLIRSHIDMDDSELRKAISLKEFKRQFGSLQGKQVKTAPRGYAKDHPAIDLLRYKQFFVFRKFSDKEVQSPRFVPEAIKAYKAMMPFLNCMSEILTTDLNGESLLED